MVQYASTTLPQSPEDAYEAQRFSRQRKMAEMLSQQGAEALPNGQMVSGRFVPTPWTQGLAKALQSITGAYLSKDADTKEREFSQGLVQKQIDAFRGLHGLGQPQADPMAEMDPDRPVVEEAAPAEPYKHAFTAVPSDPTSLAPPQIATASINTIGRPPMEAPMLSPEQELMAKVLRASEAAKVPPAVVMQDPFFQQQIALLKKDQEPMIVPQGADVLRGGSKIYTNPKEVPPPAPRNRQIVMSGGAPDALGRPTEVPMMLDPETGKAVPIEGVQPLSKGPLATASASVSTIDTFENERKLRTEFRGEPIYKAHQEVRSAYDQIKAGLKQGTPIADVAAATKIMKLLDPGSVVRESELGIAMSSTGLLDRVSNYANTIINGQRITPQQRKEFQALADEFFKMSEQQYNAKANEYKGIASDYGLNADRVGGKAAPAPGTLSPDEAKELEELRKRFGKK